MRRLAVVVLMLMAFPALAGGGHWTELAERIAGQVSRAERLALDGQTEAARREILATYFDGFENGKMEAALRKEVGARRAGTREAQFKDVHKAIGTLTPAALAELAAHLRAGLREDGRTLDAAGVPPGVFAVNQ